MRHKRKTIALNEMQEAVYVGDAIEINATGGTQEKVKISPVGEVVGLDGRRYSIDAQSVIEKSKARKIDIVLNVNHGWDSYGHKAAGWFDPESLEAREDGIYATLNLTDIGESLLGAKHYRYLSPEYQVHRNGVNMEVLRIVGVGLVNNPNILKDALNAEGATEDEERETMNEEQDNSAMQAQVERLQAQINALKEENRMLRIDFAIKSGEMAPSKKEFALSLNDEQLDRFLQTEKAAMAGLTREVNIEAQEREKQLNSAEEAVYRQLGITTGEEA